MPSKEELLKYKFELEVAYDGLGRGLDIVDAKDAISLGIVGYEKMLNYIFNSKPYKLEDLKPNMWIWDNVAKWVYKINKINSKNSIEVDNGNLTFTSLVFEENRFFPVQMANVVLNNG